MFPWNPWSYLHHLEDLYLWDCRKLRDLQKVIFLQDQFFQLNPVGMHSSFHNVCDPCFNTLSRSTSRIDDIVHCCLNLGKTVKSITIYGSVVTNWKEVNWSISRRSYVVGHRMVMAIIMLEMVERQWLFFVLIIQTITSVINISWKVWMSVALNLRIN